MGSTAMRAFSGPPASATKRCCTLSGGVTTTHNEQIALWAAEQTAHRLQGAAAQATGTAGRLCLHRGAHAQPCRHASQHAQRPRRPITNPSLFTME